MSGFDEARSGRGGGGGAGGGTRRGGTSARPAGGGGGGGAFDAAAGASSTGQHVASLGAGSYQGGDSTYAILKESIERDLRKLTTLIAATRKLSEQLGSKQDSGEMRKRIDANVGKGRDLTKSIGVALKTDAESFVRASDATSSEAGARRMQLARFAKDYKAAVEAFNNVAAITLAGMKKFAVPTPDAAAGDADKQQQRKGATEEDARLLQQLQQVDLHESLLHEREAAIDDITTSMVEVNEAFKDLSAIVDEQGHAIEQIEVNVLDAHANTEKGVGYLSQASKYQKKYGRWLIIMLIIIVLVAVGITVYFFVVEKK